ncbi:SAF domain-containing protein, partial [Microbispora triticiradicis]|uniref:SAF domain-containing protein n=1 Tax=Microbispora triticiradicis TaxID=2200763 RepID=UPI001AD6D369
MVRTRTRETVTALPLPRRRRAPIFLLVVVFVGAGVLAGQYAYTELDERDSVLMVARGVTVGQVIAANDVAPVRISADPRLATVPAGRLAQTIGRVAAADLTAGTLLAETQTTDALTPGPGQQLVPLALKPGQLPARGLHAGDHVLVAAEPAEPGQEARAVMRDLPAVVDRVGEELEHDPTDTQHGSGQIWTTAVDNVTSGTQATVTVPDSKLADGWLVRWRARAVTAAGTSAWSGWQQLSVIDSTQVPTIDNPRTQPATNGTTNTLT